MTIGGVGGDSRVGGDPLDVAERWEGGEFLGERGHPRAGVAQALVYNKVWVMSSWDWD